MKTLNALKAVAIWNCIFCFSCVASTVFLAIHHYFHLDSYLHIGVLFVYGWMVNPFARAIIHHKLYHEEICAKLGFSSTAYFRKVFQSVYHTSPSQMRKKENMI